MLYSKQQMGFYLLGYYSSIIIIIIIKYAYWALIDNLVRCEHSKQYA